MEDAIAVVVAIRRTGDAPVFANEDWFIAYKWVVPLISIIGLEQAALNVQLLSVILEAVLYPAVVVLIPLRMVGTAGVGTQETFCRMKLTDTVVPPSCTMGATCPEDGSK